MNDDNNKFVHFDLGDNAPEDVSIQCLDTELEASILLAEIRRMGRLTSKFNRKVYGGETLSAEIAKVRQRLFGKKSR